MTDLEALVSGCAQERLPALVAQLAAAQAAAAARLMLAPTPAPEEPDDTITVAQVARRLGVSKDYVYKNRKSFPFVCTIGRRVVCSARGVEKFLASRRGAYGSR